MAGCRMKICCNNPRRAALIAGIFSLSQFVVEILAFSCFAIYIVPFTVAVKVFYAFAAIFSSLAVATSTIFVISVSKDNHKWMRPWLLTYLVVSISEFIISFVGLINLNSLRNIMQFFVSAWSLAQQHQNDQLFVGVANSTECTRVSNAFLTVGGDEIRVVALFGQQGSDGLVAFIALLILGKNVLNVFILFIGIVQYQELQAGRGYERSYAPQESYPDPHIRSPRRAQHFSTVHAIAK